MHPLDRTLSTGWCSTNGPHNVEGQRIPRQEQKCPGLVENLGHRKAPEGPAREVSVHLSFGAEVLRTAHALIAYGLRDYPRRFAGSVWPLR